MTDSIRPTAKDAIIDAAFEILGRNRSASMSDIAERAGVGRATLHRHFAQRDDLFHALALIAMDDMDEAVEAACKGAQSYTEALRLSLNALIPLGDRYSFLSFEPVDNPKIASAYEQQMDETRAMVEEAKREGAFDQHVPTDWIVEAFDHLLAAAWESVKAGKATNEQAANFAWRTLTIGVGSAK